MPHDQRPSITPSAAPFDRKPHWLSIILFYLLACAISWPFFWQRDVLERSVPTFSYMWGPGIAAIIVLLIFRKRHRRTITFLGTSAARSLLFYLVPTVGLTVGLVLTGHGDSFEGMDPWLATIAFPIIGYIMVLGEELGWRGFLQDALRPLSPVKRYILIGAMWEFWHFTTRTTGRPILGIIVMLLISYTVVILLSWGIGVLTDRTRSLTVAVALHSCVNIAFEFPFPSTYVVLALAIPFWWFLLRGWPLPATTPAEMESTATSQEPIAATE